MPEHSVVGLEQKPAGRQGRIIASFAEKDLEHVGEPIQFPQGSRYEAYLGTGVSPDPPPFVSAPRQTVERDAMEHANRDLRNPRTQVCPPDPPDDSNPNPGGD